LSNGKPKVRDQSSSKFLQRIAGKKALVPPPTPRPVIGEHPVRTLLRENADVDEPLRTEPETPVLQEETPFQSPSAPPPAEPPLPSPVEEVEPVVQDVGAVTKVKVAKIAARQAVPKVKPEGKDGARALTGVEETIADIKKKYRLNRGETTIYRELYLMTHAVGETECSFVVSELVKSTGMLERRVRDNLRRLKRNGWLALVEAYDFENREKARYRVNVEPRL
jgi:hypothetical protein